MSKDIFGKKVASKKEIVKGLKEVASNQPPISKSFEEELDDILTAYKYHDHDSYTGKKLDRLEATKALTNLYAKHIREAEKRGRIDEISRLQDNLQHTLSDKQGEYIANRYKEIYSLTQDTTNTNVGDRDE